MEPVTTIVLAMIVNVGFLMHPGGGATGSGPPSNALLAENGTPILNEDGHYLLTE